MHYIAVAVLDMGCGATEVIVYLVTLQLSGLQAVCLAHMKVFRPCLMNMFHMLALPEGHITVFSQLWNEKNVNSCLSPVAFCVYFSVFKVLLCSVSFNSKTYRRSIARHMEEYKTPTLLLALQLFSCQQTCLLASKYQKIIMQFKHLLCCCTPAVSFTVLLTSNIINIKSKLTMSYCS